MMKKSSGYMFQDFNKVGRFLQIMPACAGRRNISKSKLLTAIVVFILRLGVLPPNVSPLGSFGFFGKSPLLFLGVILVFDYFVGGHYPGYLFTYLGFAMYPLLARYAHNSLRKQVLFLPLASFLFFLFSNFGVWLHWYPHTIEGLIKCYTLALPFYRNTLIGDLVFGWGYLVVRGFNWRKVYSLMQSRKLFA